MDNDKIINMIPSKTLRNHMLENKVELTPIEKLTIVRHSFKDISIREEIYIQYSFSADEATRDLALKLLGELSVFKSIITGDYILKIEDSEKEYCCFDSVRSAVKRMDKCSYCKVYAEDSDGDLACTFWITKKGKIIYFELTDIAPVISKFELKFETLPFLKYHLLKTVKQLYENRENSYVCLEDLDVEGSEYEVVPVTPLEEYLADLGEEYRECNVYYMSPLILEIDE